MKTICLVIPYFGKFPNYYRLWLESVKYNKDVNFLIVTDNEYAYESLDNVHVKQTTFEELKNKIQKLYDFKIRIKTSYKLCDFKVAYGEIFEEELRQYDFWGYCDMDLIFGNIRKYITDEILDKYEKINCHGHFSLYKNNEELRTLYRRSFKDLVSYKSVFSQDWMYHFDEYPGIAYYADYAGIVKIDVEEYADIDRFQFKFVKVYDHSIKENDDKDIKQLFYWKDGKLINLIKSGNQIIEEEKMYVHLQKRRMKDSVNDLAKGYFIVPNGFIQMSYEAGIESIDKYSKNIEYDELDKFKKECFKQKFSISYWKMKWVMHNKRWKD